MFREFKKFILRGNTVDLAVGIVVGAAFTTVINALVKDLINPLVAVFYGGTKLTDLYFVVDDKKFLYGDALNSLITFLIVAAVVFFLVVQPINKLNELSAGRKTTDEPTTKKCPYCLSTIPTEASRCKFCTSRFEDKKST
ncbi:MAG TPA: large conductance mechanosensitive channel protein MscL [Nitrososphaera sp.]